MASILLIDDDESFLATLSDTLKEYGHTLTRLADGRGARETVLAGHFDVILTDLATPRQDGFETIVAMRKAKRDLPIIAMSGMADADALPLAKKFGAVATLSKPFTTEKVISVIDTVLAHRKMPKAA